MRLVVEERERLMMVWAEGQICLFNQSHTEIEKTF